MFYAITKTKTNKSITLALTSIPAVSVTADTEQEAMSRLKAAYMVEYRKSIRAGVQIPPPDNNSTGMRMGIPEVMKILLFNAMRISNHRPADLARQLDISPRQVSGLIDLAVRSDDALLEKALGKYGVRVGIIIHELGKLIHCDFNHKP